MHPFLGFQISWSMHWHGPKHSFISSLSSKRRFEWSIDFEMNSFETFSRFHSKTWNLYQSFLLQNILERKMTLKMQLKTQIERSHWKSNEKILIERMISFVHTFDLSWARSMQLRKEWKVWLMKHVWRIMSQVRIFTIIIHISHFDFTFGC